MTSLLLVTRNFPPLVGGMERLMAAAVRELGREFDCQVVGPAGCTDHLQPPSRGVGHAIRPLFWFLPRALLSVLWRGRTAGVCLAGSGVTAPLAVLAGRLFRRPSLVFVHGLDLVVENRLYQWLFVPFIRRATGVIANSHNTARLARERGVRDVHVLFPGVELPGPVERGDDFVRRHGLEGKRVLLSVGRIVPRKGLAEFVERSLPAVVASRPDTVLLVVGGPAADGLRGESAYADRLADAIEQQGLADHVRFTGRLDDAELSLAYQTADLFVFPLRPVPGDVEGFGMVAVEAAAHGLPVVAFAEGGVVDAVEQDVSGKLVPSEDHEAFTRAVVDVLDNAEVQAERCKTFAERFSWENYGTRLREIVRTYVESS